MKFKPHYILILILVFQACKKSDINIEPPETASGAALYFSGQVDGEVVTFEAGEKGYAQGHTWGFIRPDKLPVWGCNFSTFNGFDDGISFFMINHTTTPDTSRQKDLGKTLVKGNKTFANFSAVNENEVLIEYRRNAFLYESALIDQKGRPFSIENVKDTVFQGRKFVIVTMEFEALLYSEFNKDTIEIKKGRTRVAYLATKN